MITSGPCCPGVPASITPGSVSGSSPWPPGAQSQDCITAALACSKILKELSREEQDTDSLEDMLALTAAFENRAVGESCWAAAWHHGSVFMCPPGVFVLGPSYMPSGATLGTSSWSQPVCLSRWCPLLGLLSDPVPGVMLGTLLL